MITLEREDIFLLAGAACVVVVVRQQTIFFFTALWRLLYGVGYFKALGFSGLFLEIASLLSSWWNGLGRHSSAIWNMVPICLMWTIWKERNQRTSEDVSRLDRQILESFTSTLFEWRALGVVLLVLLLWNSILLCI